MKPRKPAPYSPGPMANGLAIGRLMSVEPAHILLGGPLGGSIRIMAPASLFLATFPIGSSLAVSVHQDGSTIIATSISLDEDGQVS